MTQVPAPLQSQADMEAFTVLVLRYLDGSSSAEEIGQLKDALNGNGDCRELFVHVCRMQGNLHEAHAPRRAEFQQKAGSAPAPAAAKPADADPGADTMIGELSAEDTAHPAARAGQRPARRQGRG